MSSQPPPQPPPPTNEKAADAPSSTTPAPTAEDAAMDTAPDVPEVETWADIPEDVLALPTDEILTRVRLLDNDIKVCLLRSVQGII
jgi:26S proteasome regulatory subunit T5